MLGGSYDANSGEIKFNFETVATYPLKNIITMTYVGEGSFITPTHAEGKAAFLSTCRPIGGGDSHCNHGDKIGNTVEVKSWDISGTVPWTMDFPP